MNTSACRQGLLALLEKYGGAPGAELGFEERDGEAFLREGEKRIPLLPWRRERRMQELHGLKNSGRAGLPCVLRTGRMVGKGRSLKAELLRELDLCEWLMDEEAVSVYTVMNGPAANLVVTLKGGAVCTLEVSATLAAGQSALDRHEINTRRGVLSDRVVDTQVPQASVYLFAGQESARYTDVDFELYGLDAEDSSAVRDAFAVLQNGLQEEYKMRREYLEALLFAAQDSAAKNQCIFLAEKGGEAK